MRLARASSEPDWERSARLHPRVNSLDVRADTMNRSFRMSRFGLAVIVVGVGLMSLVLAVGAAEGWLTGQWPTPGPGGAPRGMGTSTVINLTVQADPVNGLDQVSPANFTVPQYGRVTFQITNYDTGTNPTAAMWARVMGTVSGTESIQTVGGASVSTVSWLSAVEVSHTITILPGGWGYNSSMMNGSGGCGGNGSGMGGMGGCGSNGSGMGGHGTGGWGMGGFAVRTDYFGSGGWGMSGGSMMVNLPIPAAVDNATPIVVTATVNFGVAGTYHWLCESPCDPVAMATPGYMRGTISVS